MNEKFFDDDGNLLLEVYREVKAKGAEGDLAKAFLADEFAGETHGNYTAEILYRRLEPDYNIVIYPIKERHED